MNGQYLKRSINTARLPLSVTWLILLSLVIVSLWPLMDCKHHSVITTWPTVYHVLTSHISEQRFLCEGITKYYQTFYTLQKYHWSTQFCLNKLCAVSLIFPIKTKVFNQIVSFRFTDQLLIDIKQRIDDVVNVSCFLVREPRLYAYGVVGKARWAHLSTSHYIKHEPLGEGLVWWRVLKSANRYYYANNNNDFSFTLDY